MVKPRVFSFESEARYIVIDGGASLEVGAWTDGIGIYSDGEPFCAYRLEAGKRYRVVVEELDTEQEAPCQK